jgi:hypothetical protein
LWIGGQQIGLGPALAGRQVTSWPDETVLHVLLDGTRLNTWPPGSGSSNWPGWPPTAPGRPDHRRSGAGAEDGEHDRGVCWSLRSQCTWPLQTV